MRKLVGIIALLFLVSFAANAQKKKPQATKKPAMTAEQSATLQSKKMALELDLDAKQQKAVYELYKKNAEERLKQREKALQKRKEAKEKYNELSETERKEARAEIREKAQEQRFESMNNGLDRQLANKAAMKKILNEAQFEKWSKFQQTRQKRSFERSKGRQAARENRGEMRKKRIQKTRSNTRRN